MTTLKPSSFEISTSLAATKPLLAFRKFSYSIVAIPSNLSPSRANLNFVCRASGDTSTENPVSVPNRLNHLATPWLMLPSQVDETTGEMLDCFYSLADRQIVRLNRKKSLQVPDTAKCIASTMGWLGFVDTKDCSVYLSNPFVNDVVELPSLEKLPYVLGVHRDPKSGKIINFKTRLANYTTVWGENDLDRYRVFSPEIMAHHIADLALSYPDPRSEDCIVMALQGDNVKRLAYYPISKKFTSHTKFDQLEEYSDCWIGLQEDEYHPAFNFYQMVYSECKALFYSMNMDSGLMAFDVQRDRGRRSKKVSQFPWKDLEREIEGKFNAKDESEALKALRQMCHHIYYLVTLENGDLLLIVRHYRYFGRTTIPAYKTIHFDVFRVAHPSALERIRSLDNRAVFIGRNQSFCIRACDSPGVEPDSVYFTDDLLHRSMFGHAYQHRGHDNGVFSMKNGTITEFYPYNDAEEEKKVSLSGPIFWVAPLSWWLARQHGFGDEKLSTEG